MPAEGGRVAAIGSQVADVMGWCCARSEGHCRLALLLEVVVVVVAPTIPSCHDT